MKRLHGNGKIVKYNGKEIPMAKVPKEALIEQKTKRGVIVYCGIMIPEVGKPETIERTIGRMLPFPFENRTREEAFDLCQSWLEMKLTTSIEDGHYQIQGDDNTYYIDKNRTSEIFFLTDDDEKEPLIKRVSEKIKNREEDEETNDLWSKMKTFINDFEIGDVITRAYMIDEIGDRKNLTQTMDNYRNYLTKTGYLGKIGRGKYIKAKSIPVDMTTADLTKEYKTKTSLDRMKQDKYPA